MSAVLHLIKEFPSFFSFHTKSRPEAYRFAHLEDGLPKGAVVEVSGSDGGGKTEVVLRFLAENPEARVAWIEDELTIYPCAFPQNRVGLERVLFVESKKGEALWTAHQILRSQVFGVVVLRVAHGLSDEMALRRLQLAAEKTQTTVVILAEEPARRGTWPIAVQLQARRSLEERAILLNVLKYRGQKSWQVRVG
jgi:hypothetical protein